MFGVPKVSQYNPIWVPALVTQDYHCRWIGPSILNLPFFLEKMEKVKNLMPSKALGVREVRGHLSSTTMK